VLDIFTQLCLALKHIHDRKILHRDIKAPNVLITSTGLIKLGDFGVAKCLNFTIEKAKTFTGTPYYLSPEIVQNLPYSFKSDIWSLGVLLYEICCLKLPFEARSIPLLTLKIINGDYKPIPEFYSKELKMLVNSLLRVDHEQRPSIYDILSKKLIR
jgi:NIMA (never in mitosis gene a)-related kinase